LNAPGLVCQANTSSRGTSTTLEYKIPMCFTLPAKAGACREPFRHRQPDAAARSTICRWAGTATATASWCGSTAQRRSVSKVL